MSMLDGRVGRAVPGLCRILPIARCPPGVGAQKFEETVYIGSNLSVQLHGEIAAAVGLLTMSLVSAVVGRVQGHQVHPLGGCGCDNRSREGLGRHEVCRLIGNSYQQQSAAGFVGGQWPMQKHRHCPCCHV